MFQIKNKNVKHLQSLSIRNRFVVNLIAKYLKHYPHSQSM